MELVQMPEVSREGIYLGAMVPEAIRTLFPIAARKRLETRVTVEYTSKGFKSHMKGADKAHARYVALIGEDEMKNGTIWLKDMETQDEQNVAIKKW
jgi:histidyl-tRNA synthetase